MAHPTAYPMLKPLITKNRIKEPTQARPTLIAYIFLLELQGLKPPEKILWHLSGVTYKIFTMCNYHVWVTTMVNIVVNNDAY